MQIKEEDGGDLIRESWKSRKEKDECLDICKKIVPAIQFLRETARISRRSVYAAPLFYIFKKIYRIYPTIRLILDIAGCFSPYVQSTADIETKKQYSPMTTLFWISEQENIVYIQKQQPSTFQLVPFQHPAYKVQIPFLMWGVWTKSKILQKFKKLFIETGYFQTYRLMIEWKKEKR